MGFDPVLSKKDMDLLAQKKFPKKIEKERALIKNASMVVFIYPVWWSGAPAMMKGYIDRVFSPGFAFDFKGKGMHPSIKCKKAILINTMAMPEKTFKDSKLDEAFKIIYDDMIFSAFGLKLTLSKYFCFIHGADEETLKGYLKDVEKIADSIK
jgi:NAD(P)H dehydrogenase (quinone)